MRLDSRNVNYTNFLTNLTLIIVFISHSAFARYQPNTAPYSNSVLYQEIAQYRPGHRYDSYQAELEVPEGFRNEAELIQDEERRLRLINPDVEKLSMRRPTFSGKNISFEAPVPPYGNRNDRSESDGYSLREFVPIGSRIEDEDGNLKLQVKMNLGKHQIPPLEYRLPRRWLSRQPYRRWNFKPKKNSGSLERRSGITTQRSGTGKPGYLPARPKSAKGNPSGENIKRRKPYVTGRRSATAGKTGRPARRIYGPWSKWTGCMGVCGQGMRERTRKCSTSSVDCDEEMLRERAVCQLREKCPKGMQQPNMGRWGAWSPCSATCGTSFRVRVRSCSIPGKCDAELLRQRRVCRVPACRGERVPGGRRDPRRQSGILKSASKGARSRAMVRAPSGQRQGSSRRCQKEYFAHKLPRKYFTCPLSGNAVHAKWTSRVPFLFPLANPNLEPNDKLHLEIKFGTPRTLTGWKIAGRGKQGVVATYMVKVYGVHLNAWRFLAGANHIPRVFSTGSLGIKDDQKRVFVEKLVQFIPRVSMIRFYPLQWTGKPYFKVDVEACSVRKPTVNRKKHVRTRSPPRRVRVIRSRHTKKPAVGAVKTLGPNECAQVSRKEILFYEIDYDKKVENLKHLPDLHGKGYVNLRLLTTIKTSQNHNNHVSLEVDLGRKRKIGQLLFKGALREGLPAMLRAFYLQFLDPQDNEWRWLSHLGKPTPFIITDIPVLNKEQVQTVFTVRFSHSLITSKLRIYPELWQKLPLIRMGVIACGP